MKGSDILIATTVRKRDFHIPPIKLNEISKLKSKKYQFCLVKKIMDCPIRRYHTNFHCLYHYKKSSLNLSHTVALIAYELSQISLSNINQLLKILLQAQKILKNFYHF